MKKIKVLCVDDSALMRQLMREIINSHDDMEVVDTAPDPYVARDLIKQLEPDVITLDVEMPRMDGIDFLEKLMRLHPMPVVMVSTLTSKGSEVTLKALELGAVDFVTKPQIGIRETMMSYRDIIGEKIRAAAMSKITQRSRFVKSEKKVTEPVSQAKALSPYVCNSRVIAVGASTGGTEAIRQFLEMLPRECPPVVITQHMPAGFTRSFADRLNKLCVLTVKEAENNELLQKGHAYIAPGDSHMLIADKGKGFQVILQQSEPVNRHRPSVDVLFDSVAQCVGRKCIGVLLTGMGMDGAKGLLNLRKQGAITYAQNESSCVVFGMPRAAIEMDAVDEVQDIRKIAPSVLARLSSVTV
ncbi:MULTISPECIES: protein-glutamate methylesterase/protein-glutamine glutaminase [Providencia]|uniref:protein-glutamate methylesterase/protein-glutamine glutaminase n=1 Tax=Providencia TaxID=586 RepID=UPI001C5AB560|nr:MULTISPECIES: chemotaxis response regulator protein-glutamate methylesterase [Providencia]ELR5151238.1 chemotaxis response regulator protein-glutamate methylesterase [Providencia rettgeri]QXX84753.1 chemotaxis response regulator protein-glutamate methylesterase [Providencia sp. R33]